MKMEEMKAGRRASLVHPPPSPLDLSMVSGLVYIHNAQTKGIYSISQW